MAKNISIKDPKNELILVDNHPSMTSENYGGGSTDMLMMLTRWGSISVIQTIPKIIQYVSYHFHIDFGPIS